MKNINQLIVMNQLTGSRPQESCGYHAFKNVLLSLLYAQKIIDKVQFETMRQDPAFFEAIFKATKQIRQDNSCDLTLPTFLEILAKAKNGEWDFSKHGISKENLKKLKITLDGTQNVTVANYTLYPEAPSHGLGGMEEDLMVAAATVQLAKMKGTSSHVFGLGLNNEHWIVVNYSQNAARERTWELMDSLENKNRFIPVINRIEGILTKSESDLNSYLIAAYDNSSDLLNRRLKKFLKECRENPEILLRNVSEITSRFH